MLPDVLMLIFKSLPEIKWYNIRLVCKQWRDLIFRCRKQGHYLNLRYDQNRISAMYALNDRQTLIQKIKDSIQRTVNNYYGFYVPVKISDDDIGQIVFKKDGVSYCI